MKKLIGDGVLFVLLIGETVAYWKIRYNKIRKGFAWAHILCLVVGAVILPFLFPFYPYWADLQRDTDGNMDKGIYWSTLALGHFFFVWLLRDVYNSKRQNK